MNNPVKKKTIHHLGGIKTITHENLLINLQIRYQHGFRLTDSFMEQTPFSETYSLLAGQETVHFSYRSKAQCRHL